MGLELLPTEERSPFLKNGLPGAIRQGSHLMAYSGLKRTLSRTFHEVWTPSLRSRRGGEAPALRRDLKRLERRHRSRLEDNRSIFLRRMMRVAPIVAKPGCRVCGDHGEHRYDRELHHDQDSNGQPMQPTTPPGAAMLSRRIT